MTVRVVLFKLRVFILMIRLVFFDGPSGLIITVRVILLMGRLVLLVKMNGPSGPGPSGPRAELSCTQDEHRTGSKNVVVTQLYKVQYFVCYVTFTLVKPFTC